MKRPEHDVRPFDDVAAFNQDRWNELARSHVQYSVPRLDLDRESARVLVDPRNHLGELAGKRVLCLAAGGGQQSAAFGLLDCDVTVLELSSVQLDRDRETARHYGLRVRCELGDMRDLSRFEPTSFDLVWQAHSLNFVPEARVVFREVTRVLRDGALYRLEFTNPFIHGTWESVSPDGSYRLAGPCVDGEISTTNEPWKIVDNAGNTRFIDGPREFRHTLGSVINGLIAENLHFRGFWEDTAGDAGAPAGSWQHFKQFAGPWFEILTEKRGR